MAWTDTHGGRLFTNIPTEYLESYCPMRVDRYASVLSTPAAPACIAAAMAIDKWDTLFPGTWREIAIHDDRWFLTAAHGAFSAANQGMRSKKILIHKER